MARHLFGGSPADYAMEKVGNQLLLRPEAVGTVWTAATGGTQITDLLDLTGAPITEVTADEEDGAVSFFGPDGVTSLYVDFGYTRRFVLTAIDTGATVDAFIASGGTVGGWAQLAGDGKVDPSQLPQQLDWVIATDPAYGAIGNGVADDTTALQAAVNASAAAQRALYIPAGTFMVSAPIVVPIGEGLTIIGSGWGTKIKLKAASNCFIFKMQAQDTRITMRDLTLDGNCLEQGTTGTSGGVDAAGAVACRFDNIHFIACRDDGIAFSGMTGGAFGHNNRVIGCLFDQSMNSTGPGHGISMVSSDENQVIGCDFEFLGGSGGTGFSTAVCILDRAGTQFITACNFVGGATNNTKGVRIQDAKSTKITGCNFDGTAGDSIFIAGEQNSVVGNTIFSPGEVGTAGAASGIHLEFAAARNLIQGNSLVSSPTNGRTRSLIREEAMGSAGNNQINGNVLTVKGTLGTALVELAAPGTVYTNNLGGADLGGGTGAIYGIPNASVVPTTNPVGGAVMYAEAGILKMRTSAGAVVDLSHANRNDWRPSDHGLVAWTMDPAACTTSGTTLSLGVIYFLEVVLRSAATISNLCAVLGTAGSGLTSGQCLAGLYTSAGTRVAVTSDLSTTWNSAGDKTMTLTAPYSAAAGKYYVAFLVNGTTSPTFACGSTLGANFTPGNAHLTSGGYRFCRSGTGQTALPANFTMTGATPDANNVWAAVA